MSMIKAMNEAAPGFDKVVPKFLDDGPTLSNSLLAALAEPKKGLIGYKGGKYAESGRRNIQASIATAQKFVVSNSLVEHAFLASMSRPKHLIDMLQRGIPPFSNMWIEWDEDFRQDIVAREMKKAGIDFDASKDHTADRVGYHIMNFNDQPMYMPYVDGSNFGHEGIHGDPMGFHISNDSEIDDFAERYFGNLESWTSVDAMSLDFEITSKALLGAWYYDKHKDDPNFERLKRTFIQVQAAAMHWSVPQSTFSRGWTNKEMIEIRAASLKAQAGDGRFLIALLGLLNYDLIVHETVQPPKKIDHIRFGRNVPKNEYKVVTINLPKPRGKRIYDQMFSGQGTPKKEHWRRGHWRTYRDAKGNVLRRVWIEEMKVGNPELGTIVHDYRLEKKTS